MLEWLLELRQTVYLRVLVHYKRYSPETAKWKRCPGQGMGSGLELPCPLWDTTSQCPLEVNNWGALQIPLFNFKSSSSTPHSLPGGGRVGLKCQPSVHRAGPSRDRPHPGYLGAHPTSLHWHRLKCDQRGALMSNKRHSYHSGNPEF